MNYEVKDFQKEVIEKSYDKPVLVDFWAEWCAPCKMLGPVIEKLAEENKNDWELVKVDTETNQETAANYGVRGIPNVKLFRNGEVINEFTGALPEPAIIEWLKKSIPSKFADQIEHATVLLEKGNTTDAKIILEDVQKGDINNNDVKILLAKILFFEDQKEASRLIENADGNLDNIELTQAMSTLAELLNRDISLFPESDVKQEYRSAIEDIRSQNFDSALQKFINVIRKDRNYDDDGARKACIAIFKFLGENNQITLKNRRDFGSALNV
ncbi:MAG: thioredoxin [Ignavibacteria bacterium]|nr:thioredoxin [Ignavibacteria bacterium]MBT8383557.1 thioredoxin [Ignavibacteria bacterium]MBT8391243.1 thioredoxin [Ignavibacteria bacterium]NNL21307.1 thioredoxin [Ignavibacteriaceae bacterium]